jgi:hypothetical protein
MSPHGLVQELLNRSEERLWGFVSNGLTLRVLRDNVSLTRQAYVEFDLASMMDGEVYADFVVLWLVCHESRVEGETPHECWLERWSQEAVKQGTRALDGLRDGVEAAITALGSGFLAHPANISLREALRSGDLDKQDYYRELLRLVYRLLFLFVAEDRGLLLQPDATQQAAERYHRFYSMQRLRRLAGRRRGSKHPDLYQGLRVVMDKLGDDDGCPALGLAALASHLWSDEALPTLGKADLPNAALLDAVRALATLEERGLRRAVDYRNLGAEELGSVYEALLELHPELSADAGTFALTTEAGNERKTTGSYYTPTSLISCLLDSALDPVLAEAAAKGEEAILDLKVCDPACGSGHFLVAAAHRIAKRLASVRTGDDEPSPGATRTALRDVVGHCLYGVDVNPMAVELCKVSLWIEAVEPGRPLSFLDAHVKCGNSLLGSTFSLIAGGVPSDAFKAIEGDDKDVAKSLRAQNKDEQQGQLTFADLGGELVDELEVATAALEAITDDSVEALREKEDRFVEIVASRAYSRAKLTADAWCAAFLQQKTLGRPRLTTGLVRRIAAGADISKDERDEVCRLSSQYGLFHWEVEFPQVFGREEGGFDVLLGNPPWEQIELQNAPDAEKPSAEATRTLAGTQHFIHGSNRYPLSSYGRLNLGPLFVELACQIESRGGLLGLIVPTSIATDSFNQHLFRGLVESQRLASLLDFENRDRLFPGVHAGQRFCLITISGSNRRSSAAVFSFFALQPSDARDSSRAFQLSASVLELLNPNTRTAPVFRTQRDYELTCSIYKRFPVLLDKSGPDPRSAWGFHPALLFMTNEPSFHRHVDGTRCDAGGGCVGVYEGKMVGPFDHRQADVVISPTATVRRAQGRPLTDADHDDPDRSAQPQFFVAKQAVHARLATSIGDKGWTVAFCDVTSATNERTVIAAAIPFAGAADTLPVVGVAERDPELTASFLAGLNTFVFDYIARQKIGGLHLRFGYIEQLVMPPPSLFRQGAPWAPAVQSSRWVTDRVLELSFTSTDMRAMAVDLGYHGSPFRWNPERRTVLRAELDAAFFHLYGLAQEDVDYVMETFPIVKRRDEEQHGHYRTKALILDVYWKMADAIATGVPYETILDPPPADPRVAHPARMEGPKVAHRTVRNPPPRDVSSSQPLS